MYCKCHSDRGNALREPSPNWGHAVQVATTCNALREPSSNWGHAVQVATTCNALREPSPNWGHAVQVATTCNAHSCIIIVELPWLAMLGEIFLR